MRAFRTPRSTEAATAYLVRYAELEDAIGAIEAKRNTAIAEANAAADIESEQLLAERDALQGKLEPWWAKAAASLTQGKRKSIELGGCIVGSRSSGGGLVVVGDEDAIVKVLQGRVWAGDLVVTKASIDKRAVLKVLDGPHKKALATMGFSRAASAEAFFIKRAEQAGTMAEVQS